MKLRNIYSLLICACLALGAAQNVQAQTPVKVTISSEVISSNGFSFYAHKVLPKQTLYSISKAYGVTIEQIYAVNAGLKEKGLKANSIILIPKSTPTSPSVKVKDPEPAKVTTPATPERKEAQVVDFSTIKYTTHVVKWYEDLSSISEKYGVAEEVIIKFNGLKSRTLSSRQKLMIPTDPADFNKILYGKSADQASDESQQEDNAQEEDAQTSEVSEEAAQPVEIEIVPQEDVHIVLILPFELEKEQLVDTLGRKAPKRNEYKDFYSGVLLAIHNNPQIHVTLDVFDSGSTNLENLSFDDVDAVIGPINATDLQKVLVSTSDDTAVISPLDFNASELAASHKNFVSMPPDKGETDCRIADYLVSDYNHGDNVVIVSEDGMPLDTLNILKPLWKSGITPIVFSYNILDGLGIDETMIESGFKPDAVNRVIVNSSSDGFINDAIRNIDLLIHKGMSVALYAPNRVRNYPSIDIESFHNTSLQTACPYYVDYDRSEVNKFVGQYRALFRTEPGSFAFQGYDIATFVIAGISSYGPSWLQVCAGKPQTMLQCIIDLKSPEGFDGWINYGLHHLCYGPDYSIFER